MSTERPSLWSWIKRLVDALDDDPWGTGDRLRDVVHGHSARIALDDEVVVVAMRERELERRPASAEVPVDGEGHATSAVVLAILDHRLELTDAVERGLIRARGSPDAVLRMFHAVELILDASSRVPALRKLSDEFRRDRARAGSLPASPRPPGPDEVALLQRLGVASAR